ncbi:MAG: hypothetical protein JSR21_03765 [Proteobacteria bacterium]|nr:hypothetical protein [Pseudomonadota bacterium]
MSARRWLARRGGARALLTALPMLGLLAAAPEPGPDLPAPPIPPDAPPAGALAPVPDRNLSPPSAAGEPGVTVRPTLNANPQQLPGGDPVPGSLYQLEQSQRRQFIPSPGLRLSVPLGK